MQMVMKCADLGHLASEESVHMKWVSALEEEMFRQGDLEKSKGYPISPLMDRRKEGITKSQPGVRLSETLKRLGVHARLQVEFGLINTASLPTLQFFNAIVLPLFNSLASAWPPIKPMAQQVETNYAMWVVEAWQP